MRRKLPLFVERSIQQVQVDQFELADTFARAILGDKVITCTQGCSACCYHPVLISIMEAIPIYGALVEEGRWTPSFREKLKKVSEMTSGLAYQVWLLAKIPCPLLENDRCLAYEARPFVCRTTMATGDPYYCDTQRLGPETSIVPRVDAVAEFHSKEKVVLRKHGLLHLLMPVGRAILMAERVCSGNLTLEGVDRIYTSEYVANKP